MPRDPHQYLTTFLPNPERITVGQMARLADEHAKLWLIIEKKPELISRGDFSRINNVLSESEGYCRFADWANNELGRTADSGAAEELKLRLARQLKKAVAEIDLMPRRMPASA